jgi:hypothetical protein
MLAKLVDSIPEGDGFLFEPKWDGFRAIVFRTKDDVYIQSRDLRPLDRYFPELHDALLDRLPPQCIMDGEIVIATPDGLDFDALQLRLHPAASRVAKLAQASPSSFVAFDVLAAEGTSLMDRPQSERRRTLERLLAKVSPPVYLTPMTRDRSLAAEWLDRFEGAGLDGVNRETREAAVLAREADDVQDQTRPHRRLRGRRLPLAQERPRCGRVAASRSLRRQGHAAPHWRHVIVHDGHTQGAGQRARAAAKRRAQETSMEGVGRG